jgi:hypothetical protein
MKKSEILRTGLAAFLLAVLAAGGVSCSDDDASTDNTDVAGLLKFDAILGTGQTYSFEINQEKNTVVNAADSLPFATHDSLLQKAKVKYEATIGTGVYHAGQPLTDNTTLDLTEAVQIETRKGNNSRIYTVTAVKSLVPVIPPDGEKFTSDIRNAGFPDARSYDVVLFNDKFYALTARYDAAEDKAFYGLYTSVNGTNWEQVNTVPNAIGGVAARLVPFNGKLYVLGGGRFWGTDENGVAPETDTFAWGDFKDQVKFWRSWSSSDGVSWQVDTVGVSTANFPAPAVDINTIVFKNKLFIFSGLYVAFSSGQNRNNYYYSTEDGKNWTKLTLAGENIADFTPFGGAFYEFNNKLWLTGGRKNFISYENISNRIWSSTDGVNWVVENQDAKFGKLQYAKVVQAGNALYLFGGETLPEGDGERILSNKVYRSTNGKDWIETDITSAYTARRKPSVVAKDNLLWIFGGYGVSLGSYAFPNKSDEVFFDVYRRPVE